LLVPSDGTPELQAPTTVLLELLAPCAGMPEQLTPYEVTFIDGFLTNILMAYSLHVILFQHGAVARSLFVKTGDGKRDFLSVLKIHILFL
jgi:hypothetical protein